MYQSRMNTYMQPQSNGITWVQGVEGAKAWQLQPNSNALLMDSENDGIFYIKVSDNIGMCNLRVFKFEEISEFNKPKEQSVDLSQFVTRQELNEILSNIGGQNNGKQSVQSTKSKSTIKD